MWLKLILISTYGILIKTIIQEDAQAFSKKRMGVRNIMERRRNTCQFGGHTSRFSEFCERRFEV